MKIFTGGLGALLRLPHDEREAWALRRRQLDHGLLELPDRASPVSLHATDGLKYDQRGYFEAFAVTFKNLHTVGYDVFLG